MKPFVEDRLSGIDGDEYFKIVNTGTLGKYVTRWGKREMTYLGKKYLYPVVDRKKFLNQFNGSYGQKVLKPKLILKGLNLLDASLDLPGAFIPGKTTLVVTSHHEENLLYLLAVLNSKLAIFYIKERYPASSYNQGTTFTKEMINNLPLPKATEIQQTEITNMAGSIITLAAANDFDKNKDTQATVKELQERIDQLLYGLYSLTPEEIASIEY